MTGVAFFSRNLIRRGTQPGVALFLEIGEGTETHLRMPFVGRGSGGPHDPPR